jgi:hypothetical protein
LTAKEGYTLQGVTEDFFTVAGAAATNAANSGSITAAFPATGSGSGTTIPVGTPSVKLYHDDTPLDQNGETIIAVGTGIFRVSIDSGTHDEIIWYLNGNEINRARGQILITLSKQRAGTYLVTVEAAVNGVKQSGAHTFVVQ